MSQNTKVFVRCRPLNPSERQSDIEVVTDRNQVINRKDAKNFYYDRVFDAKAGQKTVYDSVVKPLIDDVLEGLNCTVFAYGQTGTGKTYTMEGHRSSEHCSWEDDPHSGLIPRAISQLFDTITRQDNTGCSVRVSFLELYNEEAYDLLSSIDDTTKLRIFDGPAKKLVVEGLEEIIVNNKSDIYEILKRGSAKRQTAATLLNACSSRSHTVFSVTVTMKEVSTRGEEIAKVGKLNLVDLAGSENIARSGLQNKQAREAANINQSLLTLTRVMTALVEKSCHIPFRESKLTRILQDSLGGTTKTSMIATISLAVDDFVNTCGTLDYAARARWITTKPTTQVTRKTSDLDLETYSNMEIQIRNEVALEFRRETDKLLEQFKRDNESLREQHKRDNENLREQHRQEIDNIREQHRREIEKYIGSISEKNEQLFKKNETNKELEDKVAELTSSNNREIKILQEVANDRRNELYAEREDFKRRLEKMDAMIQEKDIIIQSLRDKLSGLSSLEFPSETQENKEVKKASKMKKRAPDQDETLNDYANKTFDADDEIVQVSTRKVRKVIATGNIKQTLHKELTMSGRKKRLRPTSEDDVELSPIPPRVTRATRRKLAFNK